GEATAPGRAQVVVQPGAGEPFQPAIYHDGFWTFAWNAPPGLDGVTLDVTAQITDTLGRTATTTRAIVVDVVAPEEVAMAVHLREQGGALNDFLPGDTARLIQPTLILTWTASADGGGVAEYLAGFTTESEPDEALLTRIDGADERTLEFEADE